MSLDVYLFVAEPSNPTPRNAIFIRRDGATEEVTRAEWDAMCPGREPVCATVNAESAEVTTVFEANITHNLGSMASAAGIYKHLWRPEEIGITKAEQLIGPLAEGLAQLRADPDKFMAFNPSNGWGSLGGLISFVERYLAACREHPTAAIAVNR